MLRCMFVRSHVTVCAYTGGSWPNVASIRISVSVLMKSFFFFSQQPFEFKNPTWIMLLF